MKSNLLILITLLSVSPLVFSQVEQKNFIDQPYIEVTGSIETEITPNEIYLNIVLNENDKKGKISVEQQETQLLSVLKALNIDIDKNLTVLDFYGYFKRKFLADNEVSKRKSYQLIVNDGETLGKVYQALDRIDISNISISKVSHSDIEKIKRETKIGALKVAKKKAKNYGEAIGQNIGNAIYIQEINLPNDNSFNGLYGTTNGIMIRGAGSIKGYSNQPLIQDLNIKSIIISAQVLARFTLN